ncbi:zinc-dependent metalloprotease [Olivibacter sitiensis]|uniref:zinc-dependent metalloprotease n=1 Tax=Olivibacter sitiensis TaxID=376470 RepID=UPI0003F9B082|nr:zinc-dependent metalloprotease [Olivibacter sitiensis]
MLKKTLFITGISAAILLSVPACSSKKKTQQKSVASAAAATGPGTVRDTSARPAGQQGPRKVEPKKFDAFIKKDAKIDSGMFNVYFQEDKYYFELPDSLLNRDILVVNRLSKSAADLRSGMSGYAGDQINRNVIRFDKGPNNKVFLRKISFSERSDSTQAMYRAVMNSNIQPIVGSFDVTAFGKGNKSVIIDMTAFIDGDNDVFFFSSSSKTSLRLGQLQKDRSYIGGVSSYPQNTEIKTVKTYAKTPPQGGAGGAGGAPAARGAGMSGGEATVELNTSMVLLPKVPMQGRYFDNRVGFFAVGYTDFDANPQGVKRQSLITRWRLEPKAEDMEKYLRGELVEPKKQIVYYIDPATPEKWVPYLIAGVNDWQKAFEQAGFKNAIVAKRAPTPEEDPEWSLEDARYAAIVYKPSDIPNASGPNVNDPRSGEIIESHINWYHNVMLLLRNWYFVQASPNDERARKMEFDDELMGDLIRFVSSHEVGHTLGLRHNYGSSSAYPVEKLRDPNWIKENGHAASIMDYARFNYVAQPGDGISGSDLYPRINHYDKWAIEWGYKLIPDAKSAAEETPTLNKWILAKADDPKYWFGTESNPDDPRSQNEDLGDDAMLASSYGIKNLQRIVPNLTIWTKQANEKYEGLATMYEQVVTQFGRYAGHVAKNVGGIYETPKTVEQQGTVYEFTPVEKQRRAMAFLNKEVFSTPTWLVDYQIADLSGTDPVAAVGRVQNSTVSRLLSARNLGNILKAETQLGKNAYTIDNLFADLDKGVWGELASRKPIDIFKRNLQKNYVDNLAALLSPPPAALRERMPDPTKSDISSIARGQLISLQTKIKNATPAMGDSLSKYHLQDLAARIQQALEPK